jgi:hypothetical protein
MCVKRRQNSSPENVGHRQDSIAVAVLLGKRFCMTTKGTNQHLREKTGPRSCQYWSRLGVTPQNRERSRRPDATAVGERTSITTLYEIRRRSQLLGDAWRSSRVLLGVQKRLESKRNRQSANKGTRETRLSMVFTQPGRNKNSAMAAPMRRSGGGVPVVVRGWESHPQGKGVQNVSFWMTERFIIGRVSDER